MLKILWIMGEIAPEEQFLPLSTIFYYLVLDFDIKTGTRFSLRDKRLFEITEVEITRVDCTLVSMGNCFPVAAESTGETYASEFVICSKKKTSEMKPYINIHGKQTDD